MNNRWTALVLGLTLATAISACGGQKTGQPVDATDSVAASISSDSATTFSVVDTLSTLSWRGFKPGGEHFGFMPVSTGRISLSQGKLVAGSVSIQMNGIVVKDIEGEMSAKLKGHLESADFFDVASFPEAKFELTDLPKDGVELTQLTELKGNLSLKDVTKNITIPVESAVFDTTTNTITLKSKTFTINRADWNVKYGSKSFFKGLGDKFIDDNIELSFSLVAR